jgi:class 3 adenylate cyclase
MSEGRVERRLAAILAVDVAGYSRLMGEDEEGTLAALRAVRRELADPKIAEHRGRIVKTTGDGLLVEFASVVDAVRCAVEVQREMIARNAATPAGRRIALRMGINVGDIIIEDGDIFGDGVNIAARLETLAEPGGICLSAAAHEQVRDRLDIAFDDLGEQQVKNIKRPVRTYGIALGPSSYAALPVGAPLPLPDKPSLAVLPFQNLTGDAEQEPLDRSNARSMPILPYSSTTTAVPTPRACRAVCGLASSCPSRGTRSPRRASRAPAADAIQTARCGSANAIVPSGPSGSSVLKGPGMDFEGDAGETDGAPPAS